MAKLDGRVALVTGGARGMAEAHARALVAEGARVVFGDVLEAEGAAVADDCDATYSTGSEFCVDGGILAGIHVGD